ncbi:MAG TPA: hypothetical protein VJ738_20915 [Steroidobacteraceae bacterium]|nr:hypothetical protein [Steroidobacteraceae bacterium]
MMLPSSAEMRVLSNPVLDIYVPSEIATPPAIASVSVTIFHPLPAGLVYLQLQRGKR